MLAEVLMNCTGIESIRHRSMPGAPEQKGDDGWWDWNDYGEDTRFVIITRRLDLTVLSARAWDHPLYEMGSYTDVLDRAMSTLAAFPNAYWVRYEAILAKPVRQFDNITEWLKVSAYPGFAGEDVKDENDKWFQ